MKIIEDEITYLRSELRWAKQDRDLAYERMRRHDLQVEGVRRENAYLLKLIADREWVEGLLRPRILYVSPDNICQIGK